MKKIQFLPCLSLLVVATAIMSDLSNWISTTSTPPTENSTPIPTAEAALVNEPYKITEPVITDKSTPEVTKFGRYTLYEVCMYKFIAIEGIVLDKYICDAGYKTFGIGCVNDTPEEQALINSGLTYEKVRKHLEKEFLKIIDLVEHDAPGLYRQNEKAALAMLFMSIGYERFWAKNKASWNGYKKGEGIPERTWLKQCNYKCATTGKWVRSDHIYSSKKFEVNLFFNRKNKVESQATVFRQQAIILQNKLKDKHKLWGAKALSSVFYTPLLRSLS